MRAHALPPDEVAARRRRLAVERAWLATVHQGEDLTRLSCVGLLLAFGLFARTAGVMSSAAASD